jgi:hypothetical protein
VTLVSGSKGTLADVAVTDIQPKTYIRDNLPHWGIERTNSSRYMIKDVPLFWGLVDPSYTDSPDLKVVQAESIYLPAAVHGQHIGTVWTDSFAAGSAFTSAWSSVYRDAASVKGSGNTYVPSYSGENDYGLSLKWRNLSSTPEGAAKILNLIWTDLASFATVGTKTGFEGFNQPSLGRGGTTQVALGTRQVQRNVHVLEYQDIRYAIPAMIAVGLFAIGLCGAFLLIVSCVVSFRTIIHYMNQTSMGRAVTQAKNTGEGSSVWTTSQWLDLAGAVRLNIPRARKKVNLDKFDYGQLRVNGSLGTGEEAFGMNARHRLRRAGYGAVPTNSPDTGAGWSARE